MAGAAAVLATFSALDAVQPPVRVRGYLPLTDNMPGGDATRVGDVLRIRNGTTVEVLNTDAEGRLVLADALSLATEDEPDAIVDLATLTGACMVALGTKIAGLMGNDDGFIDQVQAAADAEGEPMWPLPLPPRCAGRARVRGGRHQEHHAATGGAVRRSPGVFLQEFVGDGIPWAHLDIAGPADCARGRRRDPQGRHRLRRPHPAAPARRRTASRGRRRPRRRRGRSVARRRGGGSRRGRRPAARPRRAAAATSGTSREAVDRQRRHVLERRQVAAPSRAGRAAGRGARRARTARAPPRPRATARGARPNRATATPTSTHSAGDVGQRRAGQPRRPGRRRRRRCA